MTTPREVNDSLCGRTKFPSTSCVKGPEGHEDQRVPEHRITPEQHRAPTNTEECGTCVGGRMRLDTEAGMLSGISRKCSLRSELHWFTEFCRSQCLSQFAASFIVVRAETSIAESCKVRSRSRQLHLRFTERQRERRL